MIKLEFRENEELMEVFISDVNKNIFAFNSENGTIPVYTKNFTTLLKEEVEMDK